MAGCLPDCLKLSSYSPSALTEYHLCVSVIKLATSSVIFPLLVCELRAAWIISYSWCYQCLLERLALCVQYYSMIRPGSRSLHFSLWFSYFMFFNLNIIICKMSLNMLPKGVLKVSESHNCQLVFFIH